MESVPEEFLCPITLSIMEDPVIMPDGHTYERASITEALEVSPYSPITRQPMKIEDAVPNYALKSLIENYQAAHMPSPGVVLSSNSLQNLDYFGVTTMADPNNKSNELAHVCICPHESSTRAPISLIAMIDVSGSMASNACENITGMEDLQLTRLQLVKHALKTVISTLCETDHITLITFHSNARVLLPATKLDTQGKALVSKSIDSMRDEGATNIWDALKLGIDCAQSLQGHESNVSLMLFTDGEPNRNPPMGIIPTLEEYAAGKPMNYTISSFGFGYQLDSELLEGIARIGNGVYGYCPDCTMVGTIFINYMANALTQLCNAKLIVRGPKINTKIDCALYNGSTRNFLFSLPKESIPETHFYLEINSETIESQPPKPATESNSEKGLSEIDRIRNQYWRKRLLDILESSLNNALSKSSQSLQEIQSLFEKLVKEPNPTKFMKALMTDLVSESANHGQVSKAFSPEFYPKWGKDYLRSFLRFHKLEISGNFRDDSLQSYAGAPFMNFRKIANKLFTEIPPPEPEQNVRRYDHKFRNQITTSSNMPIPPPTHSPTSSQSRSTKSILSINSRFAGCFGGNSLTMLYDGEIKMVRNLQKGDRLIGGGYVECLIKISIPDSHKVDITVFNACLTS